MDEDYSVSHDKNKVEANLLRQIKMKSNANFDGTDGVRFCIFFLIKI